MNHASRLSGRRVLLTGGTGFIGAALGRQLAEAGVEVCAVYREEAGEILEGVRWSQTDLLDAQAVERLLREWRPDLVYHLAGHVVGARDLEQVIPTFSSNLATTVNLLAAATAVGTGRLILAGSLEEPEGNAGEATPSSPYAASKWAASAYGRMFHALYDCPVTSARMFMVYGPGQRDRTKLIPYVTTTLLRGGRPSLSSGTRPVDWVYVDDVVEGLLMAGDAPGLEGRRFDLGSGTTVTVQGVVEKLFELTGCEATPEFGSRADRPLEQVRVADTAEAGELLGWRPTTRLEAGLARTIEWYRERLHDGE